MSEAKADLAIRPTTLAEALAFANAIKGSKLLPVAFQGDAASIAVQMVTGMELGFSPFAALRAIHMIEGRPALSAEAIGALVNSSSQCEYLALTESNDTFAEYTTKRRSHPKPVTMRFTFDQAKKMGIVESEKGVKKNWREPTTMLRHRCLTALCRAVYPDVTLGIPSASDVEDEIFLERVEKTIAPVEPSADLINAVRGEKKEPAKPEAEDAVFTETKEPEKAEATTLEKPKTAAEMTPEEAEEQKFAVAMREASSLEALNLVGFSIPTKINEKAARDRLRVIYNARVAELKAVS